MPVSPTQSSHPEASGDGGHKRRYLSPEELAPKPKPAPPKPSSLEDRLRAPAAPAGGAQSPAAAGNNPLDNHQLMMRVAKTQPYELREQVARGAESALFKAVSGRYVFCAKTIRNILGRTLGSGEDMHAEGKLTDVSYASKVRHLRNEFEIGARLHDENDIPVGRIYALRKVKRLGMEMGYDLLMEHIPGGDMGDKSFLRTLSLEKKIDVLHQTLKALAFLHYRRFVHMDMKPSNIMVRPDGKVKLIDFGVTVNQGYVPKTVTGTAGYLSPEQIVREYVDEATDMFALGITFAVIFGGHALRQTPEELKSKQFRGEAKYHLESVEQPAVNVFPELESLPELVELLSHCTIPRRDKRIGNTATVLHQLERIAEDHDIALTEVTG